VTNTVREAMMRLTKKPVMVVGPGIRTGLKIMLDNPAQLGSDRVADAVAAVHEYPCPLIIIDMGTATTISAIDRDKNFLGGMIIPGLRVSLDSLTTRTSQLPKISLDPPKKVIGSNTVDCMKSGIIYSTAASIDGVVERIEEEMGEQCTVISTGGLARKIIPYCKRDIIIDDQLLLKGLMLIYHKNKNCYCSLRDQ
jgi:type III pantothenate kinase